MARTREFDTNTALDQMTDCFWRHGYEGTSLRDLMAATGLQKGSIYQAFGDKHAIFMSTLERYLTSMRERTREVFESFPPGEAIERWMEAMQAEALDEGCEKGCFFWNATSELGPHDEKVQAVLHRHYQSIREMLIDVIQRGQAEGVYRTDVDAESLCSFLSANAAGMVALNKSGFDGIRPEAIAQLMLSTLRG